MIVFSTMFVNEVVLALTYVALVTRPAPAPLNPDVFGNVTSTPPTLTAVGVAGEVGLMASNF
jgi:hypothetical protein